MGGAPKVGQPITLIREGSKVQSVVEEVHEDLGVTLVNLGFFYLQEVPNHPEIGVWTVAEVALAESLAQYMDGMAHLRESANGYRAQLLADGWSETVAEQVAGQMLTAMITKAVMSG